MKRIIFVFSLVGLLLSLTGCDQPEFGTSAVSTNILTASLEREAATKTHLGAPVDGVYYPYWSSQDQLAVYVDGISLPDKYSLSAGVGTEKGVFSGTLTGDRYVALYPYSDRTQEGLQGETLHLSLPAEQTYAAGTFGEGSFPMLAVSEEDALSFLNLCSVLKISLTGETAVRSIRFEANDKKMPVSGPATVRTDFSKIPELVMQSGGTNAVTLKCGSVSLDKTQPVDFFLVIPPGTYKGGFTLEIDTFSGKHVKTITSDVTFARSQFRYIAPFYCTTDGTIDPDQLPYDQIWYVTGNNEVYYVDESRFDRKILSNTYQDGKGVIVFDGPVKSIGESTFGFWIEEIHLPDCVETIDENAFYNASITTFRTPENLTSLGAMAFQYCYNLTSFYGPHASKDGTAIVLSDGTMAAHCNHNSDYAVPEGVVKLSASLFSGDDVLKHVTLPDGLQEIGDYCFNGCMNLETIRLPESLTKVGTSAIFYCPALRKFEGKNAMLLSDRCLVDEKGYVLSCAGAGTEEYVFPEGVVTVDYFRLYACHDIRSVKFPSSLRSLNAEFYLDCENLEFFYGPGVTPDHHCFVRNGELQAITSVCPSSYTLPDGITGISDYVFVRNKTLRRLTIPDAVTYMGYRQFLNATGLQTIVLSTNLSSIGFDSFAGCSSLDTLYCRSITPPSYSERYDEGDFRHSGLVIYVPEGSEEQYKSASTWSKYALYIKGYPYTDLEKPDYYISTDFSRNGKVTRLQQASQGAGIDLVLMGDAFSDRQVADGTYGGVIRRMMEAFFTEEPYKSYRDLFNIYQVDVVSITEGYEHGGQALAGYFGDGTRVGGDDAKCMELARNAVSDDRMENVLIIVAMNSPRYGGTCYMYDPAIRTTDYGCGTSVAYFPVGETADSFVSLVHHEAGGHGFAKLADEYAYEDNGTIPESIIQDRQIRVPWGWWKNADFTGDPEKVKWSKFLKDSRYQYDGLGVFEGAFTYWSGAWRPTEYSIMRYNTGGFNAPSREAIWYRIHKLAYGDSWVYDYEKFVEYDAVNRKTSSSSASWAPPRSMPKPTHPPVMVGKTWRELVDNLETER